MAQISQLDIVTIFPFRKCCAVSLRGVTPKEFKEFCLKMGWEVSLSDSKGVAIRVNKFKRMSWRGRQIPRITRMAEYHIGTRICEFYSR